MNATHTSTVTTTYHDFTVKHEGKTYGIRVYTKESGKFIDSELTLDGEPCDDSDVEDAILEHLSENWESIVP